MQPNKLIINIEDEEENKQMSDSEDPSDEEQQD